MMMTMMVRTRSPLTSNYQSINHVRGNQSPLLSSTDLNNDNNIYGTDDGSMSPSPSQSSMSQQQQQQQQHLYERPDVSRVSNFSGHHHHVHHHHNYNMNRNNSMTINRSFNNHLNIPIVGHQPQISSFMSSRDANIGQSYGHRQQNVADRTRNSSSAASNRRPQLPIPITALQSLNDVPIGGHVRGQSSSYLMSYRSLHRTSTSSSSNRSTILRPPF